MAEAYRRYAAALDRDRLPPAARVDITGVTGVSGVHDFPGYLSRENPQYDDRTGHPLWRTLDPLGAASEPLRSGISSYGGGGLTAAEMGSLGGLTAAEMGSLGGGSGLGLGGMTVGAGLGGMTVSALDDPLVMAQRQGMVGMDTGLGGKPSNSEFYGARQPDSHQPDASNTLFVEGLPTDCTRREVAHIFRPFIGFKQIRVIHKEPRRAGGEPFVLCFVEFADSKCAATALEALQGYKFDDSDRDSCSLRLQLARFPGVKATSAPVSNDLHRESREPEDYRSSIHR